MSSQNSIEIIDNGKQTNFTLSMKVVKLIAILYAIMHIYTAGFGSFPDIIQRSLHVTFAIILALAAFPQKRIPKVLDWLFIIGTVVSFYWIVLNYNSFISQIANATIIELVLTTITVIALLEASRRIIGILFPLLALIFILYGLYGYLLPGPLANAGYSVTALTEKLYMSSTGLWGTTTAITSTTVATFIIFGVFLLRGGGGQAFVDIGMKIAGKSVAGPAKVATVSSALFGLFSGSAAANASVVGNFTINLMKKLGYNKEYAAGVEAAASGGGQIAPPIMGAAAFIMAEYLGVSYLFIVVAAIVPAFLYFYTLFIALHYDGKRDKLLGVPEEMIPKTKDILQFKVLMPFLVPLTALIIGLVLGFTEARAGFMAIVCSLVIYIFSDLNWGNLKGRLINLLDILDEAGRSVIIIALLAGTSQILVAILSFTGLAVKITGFIVALSGNSLFLAIILSGLVVIVMGMGMPTTASYVLGASVVAPALISLGVLPIAAHMFILYYAVVAHITPPVCAGVFIAAGIAQAKWFPASIIACKLGIAKFVVPIAFIYSTGVLLQGSIIDMIISIPLFILASWFLTMGLSRYAYTNTNKIEMFVFIIGGLLAFTPYIVVCAIGVVVSTVALLINRKRSMNFSVVEDLA